MKTRLLLGAAAATSMFLAGCGDHAALGTERDLPARCDAPAAREPRAIEETQPLPEASAPIAAQPTTPAPIAPPPMTTPAPIAAEPPTPALEPPQRDAPTMTSNGRPEVMNGEDLGSITELREPVWTIAITNGVPNVGASSGDGTTADSISDVAPNAGVKNGSTYNGVRTYGTSTDDTSRREPNGENPSGTNGNGQEREEAHEATSR